MNYLVISTIDGREIAGITAAAEQIPKTLMEITRRTGHGSKWKQCKCKGNPSMQGELMCIKWGLC